MVTLQKDSTGTDRRKMDNNLEDTYAIDLRLGYVTDLYYSFINEKAPRQLHLLDECFPGFIVTEREEGKKQNMWTENIPFMPAEIMAICIPTVPVKGQGKGRYKFK